VTDRLRGSVGGRYAATTRPAPRPEATTVAPKMSGVGTKRLLEGGRACPLCPGISDIDLFRYCQGVIDLNTEISHGAFYLGMPKQELDGPEIACPSIDQSRFCASQ
jgi:hypothetical protein